MVNCRALHGVKSTPDPLALPTRLRRARRVVFGKRHRSITPRARQLKTCGRRQALLLSS